MSGRDPRNPFGERAVGLGLLGAIFFGVATGVGIGVFAQAPAAGALIGGATGLLLGLWLVPGLVRDWQD